LDVATSYRRHLYSRHNRHPSAEQAQGRLHDGSYRLFNPGFALYQAETLLATYLMVGSAGLARPLEPTVRVEVKGKKLD